MVCAMEIQVIIGILSAPLVELSSSSFLDTLPLTTSRLVSKSISRTLESDLVLDKRR